ncbi:zinc finger, CCHC-type containing protein [Tanacetum coccineum]
MRFLFAVFVVRFFAVLRLWCGFCSPLPPITTDAPIVTTVVPESNALTAVELRVAKLEKDVSELKTVNHSSKALVVLQSYVLTVVDNNLDTKKIPSEILEIKEEQAESQKNPQFTIKSTDKTALNEYDLKSALYQSMHVNKSLNRNPANHRLYHALMEALIKDENAMDKGVADTVKDHKRKHDDDKDDDDEDPTARPNQGSKTSKSALAKELVEEPIVEVIIDDAGDDVVRDDDQPQATSEPKTRKNLNPDWFKQPPRPPTPDPEWNKRQVVLDQPVQPWFNQMVSASKDPLTFNDLMTTPINFSKYVLNGLKIDNLTQDILLGPTFNLLKGTCSSSIKLEYNFQECFNALTDKLDWNNLEGDHYPFDLSKPLPLQGPQSAIKYAYDKDAKKGIKHWGERRKLWYRSQSVSLKKLHGYGHLEDIMVKRSDQQLYKFKEGDFVNVYLNDIEDMPLLDIQHKLFHLDGSDILDFIVALRMFTRSLILKRRVEDLQLSKRVLLADELYKFLDGTLKSVHDEIHHRVLDFHLDYNKEMPNRKWTAIDRKRSGLMIELIYKQLRERDIIKNLERLVGARELEMDYKLMTRTESLMVHDSDKPKGNNVVGPSVVNMVEHNNSSRYNDNKGKRKHHDNTRTDPYKKSKVTCWKCGKPGHLKKDCKGGKVGNKANGSGINGSVDGSTNSLKAYFVQDDDVAWWVDLGLTVHVCKDRCWIKTYDSLNDGSILYMGNKSTALVHGRGCVDLRFSSGKIVLFSNVLHAHSIKKNLVSSSVLNNYWAMSTLKRMQDMSKDGLIPDFDMDTEKYKTCMLTKITKKPFQNAKRETEVLELIHSDLCDLHATSSLGNKKYFVTFINDASRVWGCKAIVRLPDPKLKTLGERGIECIFVGYTEHSKAFRFSSVPRPSLRIYNGTEDIGGSVLTEEVVQQHKLELRKSKRNRTPKNFGPEFQLYLIEGTRDDVSNQHSYCFNVEDDPKTFDEAMKSQDFAFWKEAINDEMDSIMGNNTWVLADLAPGIDYFDTYALVARINTIRLLIAMASIHNLVIHQMDAKTTFLNGDLDEEVYMNQAHGFIMPGNANKEFLTSKFSMKDMGETDVILGIRIKHESNGIAISQSHYIKKVLNKFNYFDCTPVSTLIDTSEKLMPNNGQTVSQLKYYRVISCLMYSMTCTRPDIAFAVGKLSRYTSNPVLEGYTDASWISNTEDNTSTSGWVFLLGGGAIFWASKKQTCITGSTIESEFVALAAACKEAEWLKNLLLEIPLWSKPIAPISICCDGAATLANAYSQMYNGKSRHLGVRHSMIHELITNGVVSIEFVRSQQNLADHLTKGLARDLVIKSAEGMGLKSN